MVIKYSRAERRHHAARMYKRAKFIIETQWWFTDMESFLDETSRFNSTLTAKRMANNMKHCSCQMCCNVRRSNWAENNGLTLQEIKALDATKDGFEDYYCGL